jgi:RNA polymerase sigma-70 factor (ECF subfamily)
MLNTSLTISARPELTVDRDEDRVLVAALLKDEPAAWRELTRRHGVQIRRAIIKVTARFRSVLSTDDADEIYSLFCVQLLNNDKHKLRSFDPTRGIPLSGWLSMLATHAAYDLLRSRRREPKSDIDTALDVVQSPIPDPYSCCAARHQAEQVANLMAELSERDREFVLLYFGEGLEAEQVAERMGININTVYSKKHKLRAKLVMMLEQFDIAA